MATVGNRQAIAGADVANSQGATVAPDRAWASDQNPVVATAAGEAADVATAAEYLAAVGNSHVVAKVVVIANIQRATVIPERATAADQHRVAAGSGVKPDVSAVVEHAPSVGDRQSVARSIVTDIQNAAISPDRAGTGDQNRVVVSAGVVANVAIGSAVDHLSTVNNRQAVAGAAISNIHTAAVAPQRASTGYQDRIVAGRAVVANIATAVGNLARVADGQLVERTRAANRKRAAVAPERAGARHQRVVGAGDDRVADDAIAGGQHARVGDDQAVEPAVGANHVSALVVDRNPANNIGCRRGWGRGCGLKTG